MPVGQHKTYDHFNGEMLGCDLYGSLCPASASIIQFWSCERCTAISVVVRVNILPPLPQAEAPSSQKIPMQSVRLDIREIQASGQLPLTGLMQHVLIVNLPPPCKDRRYRKVSTSLPLSWNLNDWMHHRHSSHGASEYVHDLTCTGEGVCQMMRPLLSVLFSPTSFFLASPLHRNINQIQQLYQRQETRFLSLPAAIDHRRKGDTLYCHAKLVSAYFYAWCSPTAHAFPALEETSGRNKLAYMVVINSQNVYHSLCCYGFNQHPISAPLWTITSGAGFLFRWSCRKWSHHLLFLPFSSFEIPAIFIIWTQNYIIKSTHMQSDVCYCMEVLWVTLVGKICDWNWLSITMRILGVGPISLRWAPWTHTLTQLEVEEGEEADTIELVLLEVSCRCSPSIY